MKTLNSSEVLSVSGGYDAEKILEGSRDGAALGAMIGSVFGPLGAVDGGLIGWLVGGMITIHYETP